MPRWIGPIPMLLAALSLGCAAACSAFSSGAAPTPPAARSSQAGVVAVARARERFLGETFPDPGGSAAPDSVDVVRHAGTLTLPPFQVAVSDAAKARMLYAVLLAQKPVSPQLAYTCPSGTGVLYDLRFARQGRLVMAATVQASSCQFATLAGGHDRRVNDPQFWSTLSVVTGLSVAALQPR